jgi:hypothetical protein
MRTTAPVLLSAMLAAGALQVAAQEPAEPNLCLRVENPAAAAGARAEEIRSRIASGELVVVAVVPCGSEPPVATEPSLTANKYGSWWVSGIQPDAGRTGIAAVVGTYARMGAAADGQPYLLGVHCRDSVVELFVTWFEDIEADQPLTETVTGSGERTEEPWNIAVDRRTTYYPGHIAASLIDSLLDEEHVIVRMAATDGPPKTAVFDIDGMDTALVNVRAACGLE